VKAHFEYITSQKTQRLADLENKAAQLERTLSGWRESLEQEIARTGYDEEEAPDEYWDPHADEDGDQHEEEADQEPLYYAPPPPVDGHRAWDTDGLRSATGRPDADGWRNAGNGRNAGNWRKSGPDDGRKSGGARNSATGRNSRSGRDTGSSRDAGRGRDSGSWLRSRQERTEVLVNRGRHTVRRRRISTTGKIVIAAAALGAFIAILVMVLFKSGPSWPPSVAVVQSEIEKACQNPDVMSEPGQVNFACAKDTRQILWVFSLMTSGNNPGFSDSKTGRKGLEPITPAQGGEVAWSLNLHHPYNPYNPVDSLEVAARAINNIIGGATLTGANGSPAVQPGLESSPANCVRYTGSAAVITHQGFPSMCAAPVTSPQGLAALVSNVYQQWVVGTPKKTSQDAGVLFTNANNPGDPQVQRILNGLPGGRGGS
jgi:hypothetical protein